jgi:hypothetical protein
MGSGRDWGTQGNIISESIEHNALSLLYFEGKFFEVWFELKD